MKTIDRFTILIFMLFLLTSYAQAQWSNVPNENTLVCNAGEDQKEPVIITDGNGGVIIAWRDYRYNNSIFGGDIMAQRLSNEGLALWTANGIAVNAASLGKGHFSPVMAEDGYGGAVIGWGRTLGSFYNYDIFAQKLDADGTRLWAVNDVTVSDRSGTESFHQVVSDDSCGAILTWTHLPGTPGSTDIYAQRVDSAGNPLWDDDGVEICMAAESQSNPQITGDGNSGAIITWGDSRKGVPESDIYAQKISHDGTVQWTTDGAEVSNYLYYQGVPVIVSDGEGGAIIAWQDTRAGNDDIYAQRLNAEGEYVWTRHGIPVCSAIQGQQSAVIVSDGEGGAIIAWQDQRNGNHDIYAQRINASGEMQWATDGVAITIASNNQSLPVAISDNAGGIIITWWDYRSDAFGDIYAQRLNASGIPLWGDNGTAVCTVSGYQEFPVLASDGDKGAIIAWSDKRNGEHYDIYAQRIDKNGYAGVFTDNDLDGIDNKEEQGLDGDKPDYDGNSDGISDALQNNVASFRTFNGTGYVTMEAPSGTQLGEVSAEDNPSPGDQPQNISFPLGFFKFLVTGLEAGGTVTINLYFPAELTPLTYYKYAKTAGNPEPHWYEFLYDGQTGAEINPGKISLHFKDGARGDEDLTANGILIDIGGPGVQKTTGVEIEPVTPTGQNTAIIYPNPSRGAFNIGFKLSQSELVNIEVYDFTGRKVRTMISEELAPGNHNVEFRSESLPGGIYFLHIETGEYQDIQKIILLR